MAGTRTKTGNTLWRFVIAGYAIAVVCECGFEDLCMRSQDVFKSIQSLFQFPTIASSQPRLFPLLVLADCSIASAPSAKGLTTITFDLGMSAGTY